MQIEPSPRSISRHCETAALAELWDARQLWMEHKPEEACDIWWKLNAAPDIWIVVQATSEEQDWNDLQASLQCLDRWREASSDAPSINTIYTGWVAEKYVQLAEHQQAEGNISGALASADRAYIWLPAKIDGRVTLLKARLLMEQQGIDAAEQWVMAATAASNDQSYLHITWLNWAEYLIGKGEIDRAIAGYQKAIQTAPEQGSYAYERLASSYMGMKRPLEAIDALNAGVDSVSSEQQAPLFLLLGQIYEQTGDPGAAYCAYQAVLQRVTDTQSSTATTAAERSAALTAILAAPAVCE
jgi:tetratricopeptide (TPR) repeat protein